MNWSRVKSIMIFFLIGINVFLLIVFGLITYRENYIPDSVIGAATSVLASEGFPCDSDLIPNMYKSAAVLNTDFYTASELSDAFFGRQLPFRTEGYSLIAESDSDGEKLTVSGSSFAFESDRTEKSASPRKIRRALEKAGINMRGAVYDSRHKQFVLYYKGIILDKMYIKAGIDSDGRLCRADAAWVQISPSSVKKRVSFMETVTALPQKIKKKGTVKKIELAYALDSFHSDKYVFRPSWIVTVGEKKTTITCE